MISFDPVFDPAKNHLCENRLRAGPPAPQPAVCCREQNDKDHQGDHPKEKKLKILRPELDPENDKITVIKIEEQELQSIHLYPGCGKKEYRERNAHDVPCRG